MLARKKKHERFFLKFKNVILILSHVNPTFLQIGPPYAFRHTLTLQILLFKM